MHKRQGLSLIEAVIVVSILAVLIALLVPAVQRVRESARRTGCQNNLHQLGLAIHAYHDQMGGLPPRRSQQKQLLKSHDPDTVLSFFAVVLPQLGQQPVWSEAESACRQEASPYKNPPHVGIATIIKTYVCPSDSRLYTLQAGSGQPARAFGSYLGCGGSSGKQTVTMPAAQRVYLDGVFGQSPGINLTSIRDGLSQTLMVGERPPPDSYQAGLWYPSGSLLRLPQTGPNEFMTVPSLIYTLDSDCSDVDPSHNSRRTADPCSRYHFWSFHPGGLNWLYADGSVHFRSDKDFSAMRAMATRDGGEPILDP